MNLVYSAPVRVAWVLSVLCSVGCVSRETVRIDLPEHVRRDLLETNTKTLMVAVERFSKPDRPNLELLEVISDPSALDDSALAAALPTFDDPSGAPVAITLLAYAFSRKDLAIPADGDLVANRAVVHSEPIPAPQLAYRLDDGGAPLMVWQRYETLPPSLKVPLPLPARKSGCKNVVATTFVPNIGRRRFDTVVGVDGRFLVSAHDMDSGQPFLFALSDQNQLVSTATLAGSGQISSLVYDGASVWGGMSDGSLLKISAAGRVEERLALGSGPLGVSASPEGRAVASSEAALWELRGGIKTTTSALPSPPRPLDLLAAAPAGRLLGVRRDTDALGTSITTFTFDGQSWHEDSPADAQSLPSFDPGAGFGAIATANAYVLMAPLKAWTKPFTQREWATFDAPALGLAASPFHTFSFRYMTPLKDARLAVTGDAGVLDVLLQTSGGDEWCPVNVGAFRNYDGIAGLPDESALLLLYNSAGGPATELLLVSLPIF